MIAGAPVTAAAAAQVKVNHLGDVSELPEERLEPRVISPARSSVHQQQSWHLSHLCAVRPQRIAIDIEEETNVAD
jgi:hypothetical protein